MAFDQMEKNQEKVKGTFDRRERKRDFKKGDQVLMWDKRREKPGMHQKFDSLWLGPYKIEEISGPDSFYLSTTEGRRMPLSVNGSLLKHYFQSGCWPLTKFWEHLVIFDRFWDFDSLSKMERQTKWRLQNLGPRLGPFLGFGNM
jgi:hypothetical protein